MTDFIIMDVKTGFSMVPWRWLNNGLVQLKEESTIYIAKRNSVSNLMYERNRTSLTINRRRVFNEWWIVHPNHIPEY